MERDAHNCARVMGPLGYLKRRPLPNDTNYVINVRHAYVPPPVDDFSVTAQSSRPHVTTPACVTTLKWSASYNTASRLSLGSAARAISGSGLGGMEKKYVIVRIYPCTRQRTQTTTRNNPLYGHDIELIRTCSNIFVLSLRDSATRSQSVPSN